MKTTVKFRIDAYPDDEIGWGFYIPSLKAIDRDIRGLYLHSGERDAMQTIDESQVETLVRLIGIPKVDE